MILDGTPPHAAKACSWQARKCSIVWESVREVVGVRRFAVDAHVGDGVEPDLRRVPSSSWSEKTTMPAAIATANSIRWF